MAVAGLAAGEDEGSSSRWNCEQQIAAVSEEEERRVAAGARREER